MILRKLDKRERARRDDLAFLADAGVGLTEAAVRTGFNSRNSLDKWLRRHGQAALLERLLRQDYRALEPGRQRLAS